MIANPSQVIVTTGFTPQAVQVHHRVIPELHADGESAECAAANLAQAMAREMEGLPDPDRCEMFRRALADVRAFIKTIPCNDPSPGSKVKG
jgi:hypothetical protein